MTIPNNVPGSTSPADLPSMVTVCRSKTRPLGYVAIDFVQQGDCAKTDFYKIGSTITICSGEGAPPGWSLTLRDIDDTRICPREPTDRATGPTAIEIERMK